jgi:hypothetical protein
MSHYTILRNGGASQAQPGGSGFWDFLGGLFSGIGSISIPSSSYGSGGTYLQRYQFPNQQTQQTNILNNPVVIVGVIIAGILIIKIIK